MLKSQQQAAEAERGRISAEKALIAVQADSQRGTQVDRSRAIEELKRRFLEEKSHMERRFESDILDERSKRDGLERRVLEMQKEMQRLVGEITFYRSRDEELRKRLRQEKLRAEEAQKLLPPPA